MSEDEGIFKRILDGVGSERGRDQEDLRVKTGRWVVGITQKMDVQ